MLLLNYDISATTLKQFGIYRNLHPEQKARLEKDARWLAADLRFRNGTAESDFVRDYVRRAQQYAVRLYRYETGCLRQAMVLRQGFADSNHDFSEIYAIYLHMRSGFVYCCLAGDFVPTPGHVMNLGLAFDRSGANFCDWRHFEKDLKRITAKIRPVIRDEYGRLPLIPGWAASCTRRTSAYAGLRAWYSDWSSRHIEVPQDPAAPSGRNPWVSDRYHRFLARMTSRRNPESRIPLRLWRRYQQACLYGQKEFSVLLDKDVFELCAPGDWFGCQIYNYYLAGGPLLNRNRRQAATAVPAITRYLPLWAHPEIQTGVSHYFVPYPRGSGKDNWLAPLAVDRGGPLIEALASDLGVGKNVIRSLRRAGPLQGDNYELEQLALRLAAIPGNLRPRTARDFDWLVRVIEQIPAWSPFDLDDEGIPFLEGTPPDLRGISNRWLILLAKAALQEGWNTAAADCLTDECNAEDFVRALTEAICGSQHPPTKEKSACVAVFGSLYARTSLKRLVAWAHRWHEQFVATHEMAREEFLIVGEDAAKDGRRRVWPAIFKDSRSYGERMVVPLLSVEELETESRQLRHCVLSYQDRAMEGSSFLFSFRSRDGRPLSTLELAIDKASDLALEAAPLAFIVKQHRAANNKHVGAACGAARQMLLEDLARGNLDMSKRGFLNRVRRCSLRRQGPSDEMDDIRDRIRLRSNELRFERILDGRMGLADLRKMYRDEFSRLSS